MKKTGLIALSLMLSLPIPAHSQSGIARNSGEQLLAYMYKDMQHFYYDSLYAGVDLKKDYESARGRIKKFRTDAELVDILGGFLKPLHDSHTFFLPPEYNQRFDYGFDIRICGELALVTRVYPGSDAERAGLKPGDTVVSIDGVPVSRTNYNDLAYDYFLLLPRDHVVLAVVDVDGRSRELNVQSRVEKDAYDLRDGWAYYIRHRIEADSVAHENAHRWSRLNDKVFLWKMPEFVYRDQKIDDVFDKAAGAEAMVLDLRGNPGGSVETLRQFMGFFYAGEDTFATMKSRDKSEPLKMKRSSHPFAGKLFIIIDSETASAAEIFARYAQLKGRAKLIGDRSAGSVRVSQSFTYTANDMDAGASIAVADVIMPDGQSLEGVGVQPNETVITKNYNLAEKTDPVLSYALALAGYDMTPEQAARIYDEK